MSTHDNKLYILSGVFEKRRRWWKVNLLPLLGIVGERRVQTLSQISQMGEERHYTNNLIQIQKTPMYTPNYQETSS